jgi:hypothetical protein
MGQLKLSSLEILGAQIPQKFQHMLAVLRLLTHQMCMLNELFKKCRQENLCEFPHILKQKKQKKPTKIFTSQPHSNPAE